MTPLYSLKGSELLPKKKEIPSYLNIFCADYAELNTQNQIISQLEQVEICVDEKIMAKIIAESMLDNLGGRPAIDTGRIHAKALSKSKEKWLKLEVRK